LLAVVGAAHRIQAAAVLVDTELELDLRFLVQLQ
jgi:hypothetical protein